MNERSKLDPTPWIESPTFESHVSERCKDESDEKDARTYREKGFLILPQAVPTDLIDRVRKEAASLFRPQAPDGPRSAYRAQDGWLESPAIGELAALPHILAKLKFLYGREPFPFQTLNFLRGTGQRAHSDSIHFSCRPPRFMCGVWVALEDIHPGNGPLFYYPGSHRLPEYNLYDMGMTFRNPNYRSYEDFQENLVRDLGLKKEVLIARKGDALIWASNLLHGGEKILMEGSTRWSQVTHYYFRDCMYYTPMFSDFLSGDVNHREVRDIRTGKFVDQSYNGEPISLFPTGRGRYRIRTGTTLLSRAIIWARRLALDRKKPF